MGTKKKKKKKKSITQMLDKSPINYFSDLFVVTMVIAWIIAIIVMMIAAVFATMNFCDTSIWGYVANLVSTPLSYGGAIWMIKNSVQHAIAYNRGETAHQDFPKVNADGENDGVEESVTSTNKTTGRVG